MNAVQGQQPVRPFSLIVKPTGAACNLDCSYCFFLSKEALWDAKRQQMSPETLRAYLTSFLAAQPDGQVVLTWQGGEPTLRGLDFYREAARLADELKRPDQTILQTFQTNGTLLDDEWGEFLAEQGALVGISLDGPVTLHDQYRINKAGRGTHRQVVRGWEVLRRHGVAANILCTVNSANADHPLQVYRHFRDDLGAEHIQFIPIVERVAAGETTIAEAGWRDPEGAFVLYRQDGEQVTSRSVRPDRYGQFLIGVFDEWVNNDIGRVFVQDFDVMLGAVFGHFSLCVRAPECGTALAMEHNGDIYACDHYVEPGYLLGNLQTMSFASALEHPAQREFGRSKRTNLPTQCVKCPVRWACHGGCPKDRFCITTDGEPGLNYLCAGYYSFFNHATPAILEMAKLLQAGRSAAELMTTNWREASRVRCCVGSSSSASSASAGEVP